MALEGVASHDNFGARDPYRPISAAIFLTRAAPDLQPSDPNLEAARPILELCSRLPISLSVAGASVADCMTSGIEFKHF